VKTVPSACEKWVQCCSSTHVSISLGSYMDLLITSKVSGGGGIFICDSPPACLGFVMLWTKA